MQKGIKRIMGGKKDGKTQTYEYLGRKKNV
jgi:hypothetical protein